MFFTFPVFEVCDRKIVIDIMSTNFSPMFDKHVFQHQPNKC